MSPLCILEIRIILTGTWVNVMMQPIRDLQYYHIILVCYMFDTLQSHGNYSFLVFVCMTVCLFLFVYPSVLFRNYELYSDHVNHILVNFVSYGIINFTKTAFSQSVLKTEIKIMHILW